MKIQGLPLIHGFGNGRNMGDDWEGWDDSDGGGDDWGDWDDSDGDGDDWGDWGDWGDSNYGDVEESETYKLPEGLQETTDDLLRWYEEGKEEREEFQENVEKLDEMESGAGWVSLPTMTYRETYKLPEGLEETTDAILRWYEEGKEEREEFQENVKKLDKMESGAWWVSPPTMTYGETSHEPNWFEKMLGAGKPGAEIGSKSSGPKPTDVPNAPKQPTTRPRPQARPVYNSEPSMLGLSVPSIAIIAAAGLAAVLLLRKK